MKSSSPRMLNPESRMLSSSELLERFRRDHAQANSTDINLTLRPAYRDLLQKLGNPHQKLPPVIHVAGTNGKGSTCAFLRSILEAEGYKVHVYTSPHLVSFHERIRIAGELISKDELVEILTTCLNSSAPGSISYFEAATATAFTAFARHKADFTILETGLGGRLDATNIVEKKLATVMTRLSYDHREYLGDTLADIAREKAGIMRAKTPCFVASQPNYESLKTLSVIAGELNVPLVLGGKDWNVKPTTNGFRFHSTQREIELPPPNLLGHHQFWNAGLAIATLIALQESISEKSIIRGLQSVEWPARLQKLTTGKLPALLPQNWELWLDGGHNDSAGEVLATQAQQWQKQDNKPLHLIIGMLTTKHPHEFLKPLQPHLTSLHTVTVPNEPLSFSNDMLADQTRLTGLKNVKPSASIPDAMKDISLSALPGRILICGSLYLAGHVLHLNDTRKA